MEEHIWQPVESDIDQPIFQSEETQQHIKGTKGSRFRPTAFSLMKLVCFFTNQSAATS